MQLNALNSYESCGWQKSLLRSRLSLVTLPVAVGPLTPSPLFFLHFHISADIGSPNNNYKWLVPIVTQQIINCVSAMSPVFANPSRGLRTNILNYIQGTHTLFLKSNPH